MLSTLSTEIHRWLFACFSRSSTVHIHVDLYKADLKSLGGLAELKIFGDCPRTWYQRLNKMRVHVGGRCDCLPFVILRLCLVDWAMLPHLDK